MTNKIIETIKADLLQARKNKESTAFYSFILSEIQKVGKSNGNRETTEDEAIRIIKKVIDANVIVITIDDKAPQVKENEYLSKFLPTMIGMEELRIFIEGNCKGLNIGKAMGVIKKQFGSAVDMKAASVIVKSL